MMKSATWRLAGLVLALALPAANSHAQLDSLLKKGGHGAESKSMAGMAGMSMTSGSIGNVAGLLKYCIGNDYLSGTNASKVQNMLMGKLPGGVQTKDPAYSDGEKGLLHATDGNTLDLNGGSSGSSGASGAAGAIGATGASGDIQAELTKTACDTVLAQAKSFL
jgi:hypothetical protein